MNVPEPRMHRLQVCIISWAGQHAAAVRIAQALQAVPADVCIVYSDPDPAFALAAPCPVVRTDNALFWADKFSHSLTLARDRDLLVIHADCDCDDWPALVARCLACLALTPAVQMWAPEVQGTVYSLPITAITTVKGQSMRVVAYVDGIVFAIRQRVVQRMRKLDYRANVYGWGIDWLMVAHIYARGGMALVDPAVRVRHAPGRGYAAAQAFRQMPAFLSQMSVSEAVMYRLLLSHVQYQRSQTGASLEAG